MAGTIFSLALSQRLDAQGRPLINAPLYIYAANTSTPVDVYMDYGLTVKHPWPMRTDSAGMVPAFWLDDGQYRARFTDPAGAVVYFDMPSVQAIGPSEGGGGGGGGGGGVDPNAILKTGDVFWQPISGTRSGCVRANARTIGSATSGATERANADTQVLYEFLWNNFSDTLCPVTGGRGASAASDFAANKPIATLDMRGYSPMGLDDMGNSPAGRITDGTPTSAASSGGSEKRSFVIARENLPSVNLTGSTNVAGEHAHTFVGYAYLGPGAGSGAGWWGGTDTHSTAYGGSHQHTVTVPLGGSAAPILVNTMSPYRLGTWFIRL